MVPPGLSWPRFSASRMIQSAALSFTDWPGFRNSALPRMVQPVSSDARLRCTSGVLPIRSMKLLPCITVSSPWQGRAELFSEPR